MRLIDILNKIANGELKEGTKVIYEGDIYTYKKYEGKMYASLYKDTADSVEDDLFSYQLKYFFISSILNDEVELIEPDHSPDVGKMAEHLREDTKMIEPTECEHEWKRYSLGRLGQRTENHRYCSKCGADEIEPTDNTKIEELDILEIEDSQNIDNIGLANSIGDLRNEIREIQHKLNEVIRYINK